MSITTYRDKLSIEMIYANDRVNRAVEWEKHVRKLHEYAKDELSMARLYVEHIKEMSKKDCI